MGCTDSLCGCVQKPWPTGWNPSRSTGRYCIAWQSLSARVADYHSVARMTRAVDALYTSLTGLSDLDREPALPE
jgi:hypothetical protein